jgi:hypothetical protein
MEMVRIADQTEILDVLYGEGAWEISKALTEKEKRTQARVGLASNIVGLAAGVVGTKDAAQKFIAVRREKKGLPVKVRNPGRFGRVASKYAVPVAAGALGLQLANNAGDVVANQVLARESKKKIKVDKADTTNLRAGKYTLAKKGVNLTAAGAKQAPKVGAKAMAAANQVPEVAQKAVEVVRKDVDFSIRGEISKMDVEKKQVFGWASVIEVNGEPVIDLQGDVMTIDTIEKAAYDYVHKSRKGGRQHQRNGEEPLHVSDMIETFVLTPEKKEQMGLPGTVPTGWWVGFQINDDDTWQAYKDGQLKEFSIHGSGTRKELAV